MASVLLVKLVNRVLGTSPPELSLIELRKSIRNKRAQNSTASKLWATEVAAHRNTSKSSITRKNFRREGVAKGGSVSDAAFSPKYKQDSEAYKRRPGVKGDIMNLLEKAKQGGRILGFKI